jgi:hypothetical protein
MAGADAPTSTPNGTTDRTGDLDIPWNEILEVTDRSAAASNPNRRSKSAPARFGLPRVHAEAKTETTEERTVMSTAWYFLLVFLVNPFMGAALRGWQDCCLKFSLTVALYLFPFLLVALCARFIPWFGRHSRLRAWLSWSGLVIWCLGAPFSCLHALS